MYSDLEIEDFRGIRSLSLDRLARVNLLVGGNSVGKTSVLEAIWLVRGAGNPTLPITLASKRGTQPVLINAPDSHWLMLFRNLDPQIPIKLVLQEESGPRETLQMRVLRGASETLVAENGHGKAGGIESGSGNSLGTTDTLPITFQMVFSNDPENSTTATLEVSNDSVHEAGSPSSTRRAVLLAARSWSNVAEIAERFSICEDLGRLPEIVEALRIVEPDLEDLSLGFSSVGNRPILYMKKHGMHRRLPFDISGGGGRRLLELLVSILSESNVPVMIDEIENGIYYANLEQVWRVIDHASKVSDCQMFITTHSLECIHAAVDAFKDSSPEDLRIFRLESREGDIRIVDYDFDVALAATEANLEMR